MISNTNKKLLWQIPFLLFLAVGTVWIIRQHATMPYKTCNGQIFGTTYSVTYQYEDDLQKAIEDELKKVDDALSTFNKESTISHINNNEATAPNEMFTEVFLLSKTISENTGGAFDITVAPLVNLWGFGFKNGEEPSQAKIDSIGAFVGYKKVNLLDTYRNAKAKSWIKKDDPRVMLDCSAIAKGYGVDVVARLLRNFHVDNFMVEIGGEVVTSGVNPDKQPWRVGIVKPSDNISNNGQELQTILNISNKAMATSGNYRNFYYKDGQKYAHTIDPKTGRPVQHGLLSATVIANDCATADAYATAFMVMGVDKARKVLKKHPELQAYFIFSDGNSNTQTWMSSAIQSYIKQ